MNTMNDVAIFRQIKIDILKETSDLFETQGEVSLSSQSEVLDSDSSSTSSSYMFDVFCMAFAIDDSERSVPKQISLDDPIEFSSRSQTRDSSTINGPLPKVTNFDESNKLVVIEEEVTETVKDSKFLHDIQPTQKNPFSLSYSDNNHQVQSASSNKSPPTKKRRGRPKRDPAEGWPKRPLSAYNIYFRQERKKLVNSFSNDNNEEQNPPSFDFLTKVIASRWKQLSDIKKIPFKTMAESCMKKYRRDVALHLKNKREEVDLKHSNFGYSFPSQARKKHKVSELSLSSLHTCNQQNANVTSSNIKGDTQKFNVPQPWPVFELGEKQQINPAFACTKTVVRRRGRPKRDPSEGWPKRPLSGYNIFFKHERERLRHSLTTLPPPHNSKVSDEEDSDHENDVLDSHEALSFGDLAKTIGSNWKKLTEAEQAFYNTLAEANMDTYRKEMKVFLSKRQEEGMF